MGSLLEEVHMGSGCAYFVVFWSGLAGCLLANSISNSVHYMSAHFGDALAHRQRDFIPWVRFFERIGRRTYGIYLSHLLFLNLFLYGLAGLLPALFQFAVLTCAISYCWIGDPIICYGIHYKKSGKAGYRYVFG